MKKARTSATKTRRAVDKFHAAAPPTAVLPRLERETAYDPDFQTLPPRARRGLLFPRHAVRALLEVKRRTDNIAGAGWCGPTPALHFPAAAPAATLPKRGVPWCFRPHRKSRGRYHCPPGLLCGPFTLASHLRGNAMDMFDDEDYVKDLLGFCADCAKALYLDAGMDVIAVVDPLL